MAISTTSSVSSSWLSPVRILILLLIGFLAWRLPSFISPPSIKLPAVEAHKCMPVSMGAYRPGTMSVPAAQAYLNQNSPTLLSPENVRERIARVRRAEAACRPGACTREAQQEYRSAIVSYVSNLAGAIHRMDMLAGERGAFWAANQTRSLEAVDIMRNYEERLRAGLYDHGSSNVERATMLQIVSKGSISQMLPCDRQTN